MNQTATAVKICPHCKGDAAICGGRTFVKKYKCSGCGTEWEDTWCCACNDRCPNCDAENEPVDYEEYVPTNYFDNNGKVVNRL